MQKTLDVFFKLGLQSAKSTEDKELKVKHKDVSTTEVSKKVTEVDLFVKYIKVKLELRVFSFS